MRHARFAARLAAAFAWLTTSAASAAEFSAYPAPVYKGPITQPAFHGAQREYATFRTRIRASVAAGPAFGGHYALAIIGCGAGCRFGYITDLKTGLVYDLPLGGEEYPAVLYRARSDSRLLQTQWELSGTNGEAPLCAFQDFVWTGAAFKSLAAPQRHACVAWDDLG